MDEATASDPEIPSESAQENLRVIRELMERATVYRAISEFPAIVGGLLSIVVGAVLMSNVGVGRTAFVLSWLGVLAVVGGLNTWLLIWESKGRKARFPTPQMIHGILAMGPPMIVLGCVGLAFAWFHGDFVRCALIWAIGYGLGLLATSSFAPRSIKILGWLFLTFGFVIFILHELGVYPSAFDSPVENSSLLMLLSFGILHLVYVLHTFREKRRENRDLEKVD